MLTSVHAGDVLRCEEIFRANSGREVLRPGGVMQYFLVSVRFCNLFFSLLGHPKRKTLVCQQAHEVKPEILGTEMQSLNVSPQSYSFPLKRSWLESTFSLEKCKFFSDRFTSLLHPNS